VGRINGPVNCHIATPHAGFGNYTGSISDPSLDDGLRHCRL
jgi:hypothetical protein